LKYCLVFPLLVLWLFILSGCVRAEEDKNLFVDSIIDAENGSNPDIKSWRPLRAGEAFDWSDGAGKPLELDIRDDHSEYAKLRTRPYWFQELTLDPGWYLLSSDVRTENDSNGSGAVLTFCEDEPTNSSDQFKRDSYSAPLCGTTPPRQAKEWKPLRTYLKVDRSGQTFEIRLGLEPGAGSGKVYFRRPILVRVAKPTAANVQQIDLDQFRLWREGHRVLLDNSSLFDEFVNLRWGAIIFCLVPALAFLEYRLSSVSHTAEITIESENPDITPPDAECGVALGSSLTGHGGSFELTPFTALLPSLATAVLFVSVLLFICLIGKVEWVQGIGFLHVRPGVVGGDEPHYLMITNSLLFDHDLVLQDDYQRVARGGLEAGARFSGVELDHHTVVVNRRTGHHALGYNNGIRWQPQPGREFAPSADVYEVSAHPVTFPGIVALAIWPFRPAAAEVEGDAGFVVAIIAWLVTLATYFLGRQAGMSRGLAVFAAMLLLLASPWLAYSRSYFREPAIGLAMILALWAAVADLPVGSALGAIAAAAMKPAYLFVGACLAAEDIRERKWTDSFKIILGLGLAMIAFVVISLWLRKTVIRSGLRMMLSVRQRFDTLFDSRQGLLMYAPWTLLGLVQSLRASFSFRPRDRLLRRMAGPLAINLIASSGFGPGFCYGPRYWVPFLPWLAVATVEGIKRAGFATRVVAAVLILVSMAIAVPGALCYPELFQTTPLQGWRMFSSSPTF
jgi:hypothetical protein